MRHVTNILSTVSKSWAKFTLPIVLIAMSCTTMAQATETQSSLVPNGWVHDYDYASSLRKYLADQAALAEQVGKAAYVYFFTDADPHCLSVRELVSKPYIAAVFDTARIVMLNHQFFEALHTANPVETFDPGTWPPLMYKISDTGTLTLPFVRPDLYLYHPAGIPEKMIRVRAITWRGNKAAMEQIFVRRMQEYLSGKVIEKVIEPEETIVEQRRRQH